MQYEPFTREPVRGLIGDVSFLQFPGLEAARMLTRGKFPLPPMHHLVGLTPTQAGIGTMTWTLPITGWIEDGLGIIWGGVNALVADVAISMSLFTGLPPGKTVTTSELSINYLRAPVRASERLVARGRSVYLGRDVGVAEATVEDAVGRTMAHATTRCVVVDIPVAPGTPLPEVPEPITDPPDPYLRPVPEHLSVDPSEWIGDRIDTQRRYIAGELPPFPIQVLTGTEFTRIDVGEAELTMPASPWLSVGSPAMYGGVLAWLCDQALTSATWSTLPGDSVAASLDLQVRFLRPVMLDGRPLRVVASVRHQGRRIRLATADAFDADGRLVASAMGSSMVIPGALAQMSRGRNAQEIVDSA